MNHCSLLIYKRKLYYLLWYIWYLLDIFIQTILFAYLEFENTINKIIKKPKCTFYILTNGTHITKGLSWHNWVANNLKIYLNN